MKTYDLKDGDGQLYAFEVGSLLFRNGVSHILRRIPGVSIVWAPSRFKAPSGAVDAFCEFELEDVRFIVCEPWGDNSRYWVGPKVDDGKAPHATSQIGSIRDAFGNSCAFLGIIWPARSAGFNKV